MIVKIVHYLTQSATKAGYWDDKWHASPYYATHETIVALAGLNDHIVRAAIQWILDEQHENGSWGQGSGTVEESAWALDALAVAGESDPGLGVVLADAIQRGASYVADRVDDRDYPALWIGKSLYTPPLIVRAIIISALYRARAWQGSGARGL